jgi:hypothetical protein
MNTNLVAISGADRLDQIEPVLNRFGGPKGLMGRMAGLGQAEIQAGIPGWAWFGVGVLAGGALVWLARDKVEKVLGG